MASLKRSNPLQSVISMHTAGGMSVLTQMQQFDVTIVVKYIFKKHSNCYKKY